MHELKYLDTLQSQRTLGRARVRRREVVRVARGGSAERWPRTRRRDTQTYRSSGRAAEMDSQSPSIPHRTCVDAVLCGERLLPLDLLVATPLHTRTDTHTHTSTPPGRMRLHQEGATQQPPRHRPPLTLLMIAQVKVHLAQACPSEQTIVVPPWMYPSGSTVAWRHTRPPSCALRR
jgi:hypothetical protein